MTTSRKLSARLAACAMLVTLFLLLASAQPLRAWAADDNYYAALYADGTLIVQKTDQFETTNGAPPQVLPTGSLTLSDVPWENVRSEIETIIVKDGIEPTDMTNWFDGCENLVSLDLSGLVTTSSTTGITEHENFDFIRNCYKLERITLGPSCDLSEALLPHKGFFNDDGEFVHDGTQYTGRWVNSAETTNKIIGYKADTYYPQQVVEASDTTVTLLQNPVPYRKDGVNPSISVSFGGYTFREGVDFAVLQDQSYPSAGSVAAKVSQRPIGSQYSTSRWFLWGEKSFIYTIAPADIGDGDFSIENLDDFWFNDEAARPYFIVIDKRCEYNNILTEGEDFTVTYLNNTKPGIGTVVVKGIGNYTGELRKSFRILSNSPDPIVPPSQLGSSGTVTAPPSIPVTPKLSLTGAEVIAKSKVYTGKTLKPSSVTVKVAGHKLRKDVDYTLSYKSGKKIGSYKVTVRGIGSYEGIASGVFQIVPKGVAAKKPAAAKRGFTAKWARPSSKHLKQTTGYQVSWSTDKKFKKGVKSKLVKGAKKTSLKVAKLKAKKTYYVKVRAYKQVGKAKYYSAWSKAQKVKAKK